MVRVTPAEKEAIWTAAAANDLMPSVWIRALIRERLGTEAPPMTMPIDNV
jgi:hypothetical protein